MLTTRHGEELRSRPMVLVQDEYDGILWFYTDLESEKVFELESDNDVCISFADPDNHVYVSLTGVGRTVLFSIMVAELFGLNLMTGAPPNIRRMSGKVTRSRFMVGLMTTPTTPPRLKPTACTWRTWAFTSMAARVMKRRW